MASKKGHSSKKTAKETQTKTPKKRQKVPAKQRWKTTFYLLLLMVWVFAMVMGLQLAVGYAMIWIMVAVTGSRDAAIEMFSEPVWTTVYTAVSFSLALLVVIFLSPHLYNWLSGAKRKIKAGKKGIEPAKVFSREELGLKGLPTWTDIGLAVAGLIATLMLAAVLNAIFSLFPWFDVEQAQDVGYTYLGSDLDRVVAFIALVVIAPFAEETIFRGWLYAKMRGRTKKELPKAASIVLSSLLVSFLFGFCHGQWNVGLTTFAMSMVMCGLREVTGTIYSGILVHMLKNGIAFYLLYVVGM